MIVVRSLTEPPMTSAPEGEVEAQADIALEEGAASDQEVGRVVEAISEPRDDLDPMVNRAD